ncbi:unnamed protein product, partial [Amoebophrya sp. A25]
LWWTHLLKEYIKARDQIALAEEERIRNALQQLDHAISRPKTPSTSSTSSPVVVNG